MGRISVWTIWGYEKSCKETTGTVLCKIDLKNQKLLDQVVEWSVKLKSVLEKQMRIDVRAVLEANATDMLDKVCTQCTSGKASGTQAFPATKG